MLDFARRLVRLRSDYPLLHRDRFVHGQEQFEPSGFSDIQWLRADGQPMQEHDWHDQQNNFLAMLLAAEAMPARDPMLDDEKDAALVIVFNADPAPVELVLPESQYHWRCVFTTADTDPAVTERASVEIEPRSVQLFELQM
jgi:glycogen operon protein